MGNAASNFPKLRNLAFYDSFNPEYIYFQSLNSPWLKETKADGTPKRIEDPEYTKKRLEVIMSASQGNREQFKKNKETVNSFLQQSNYAAKFNQCLKVIQKGIEIESKNEIAYFKQQLANFEKTFTKEEIKQNPELQQIHELLTVSCKENSIIEYEEFLALVNGLLSGFREAYGIMKYEAKHIASASKALQRIVKNRQNQLDALADKRGMDPDAAAKMIEKSINRLNNQIKVYYIKNKTYNKSTETRYNRDTGQDETISVSLRGASRAFRSVHQATDNEIAKWMRKQITNIFKNRAVMSKITAYLQKEGVINAINDKKRTEDEVKKIITNAIAAEASKSIPEILNGQYRTIHKRRMVHILKSSVEVYQTYRIEGFYPNYFMVGKHLKGFRDLAQAYNLYNVSSEEFMAMFERLRDLKKKNKRLSRERARLYEFMEGKGIYKDFSNLVGIIRKLESVNEKLEKARKRLEKSKYDFSKKNKYENQIAIGRNTEGKPVYLTIRITPEKAEIVDDLDQSLSSLKVVKTLFGDKKQLTFSTLNNSIANLRRQGSMALRDTLAKVIDDAVSEAMVADQAQLRNDLNLVVQEGLQNLHISVRGPSVAELMSAINFETHDKNKVIVNLYGRANAKNDVIVMSVDYTNLKMTVPLEKIMNNQDKIISDLIAQKASSEEMAYTLQTKTMGTFQESIANAFSANSQLQASRYTMNQQAFLNEYQKFQRIVQGEQGVEVNKIYDEVLKDWQDYEQELTNRGEYKEYIDKKREEFLQSVENSFYISTTVKSYDYYNDQIGFGGGSLGNNLTSQLNNIADIFELAGMPMTDKEKDWLFFLIRNTGDQLLFGNKYQNVIETYLGSLAAFMLFDEGGAEVKILNDLIEKGKITYSSPRILHLYRVNGIYITGSYVLKQVEKDLLNYQDILAGVIESRYTGAGIHIINDMNEGMIQNRGEGATATPAENPWKQVAKVANSHVSLEIFFLAGLMDIAEKLESKLANIQLPTK